MLHIRKDQGNFFGLLSRSRSNEIIRSIAQIIASDIQDESLRGKVKTLVDGDDSLLFANFNCLYSEMGIADSWRVRQVLALYTKNADRANPRLLKEKLYQDLSETEQSCALINKVFSSDQSIKNHFDGYEHILFMARRKIADILGECPRLEDVEIEFGPGASNTVKGKTTARWKLNANPVISREALSSLTDLWGTLPYYAFSHKGKAYVGAGEFAGVPKDALSLRGILIEAALQTAVQKGYGKEIRKALRKVGIDLNDQLPNQRAAQLASLDWESTNVDATIDLRRASSTIASLLVSNLLPLPWVEALSNWRTGCAWVGDGYFQKLVKLEMFSSMGNGYTFELESLIFYALTWALCVDQNVSTSRILVFGDDIVCPASIVEPLTELFTRCGFEINLKKSCFSGPFRESCGGDFLYGRNIRPFYVKERLSTARLVGFHNYLVRLKTSYLTEVMNNHWPKSFDFVEELRPMIDSVIAVCLQEIPISTPKGPDGYGDGHLVDPIIWDYMASRFSKYRLDHQQSCLASFRTFEKKPIRRKTKLKIGDDLYPSYSIYLKKEDQFNTVRLTSKNALRRLACVSQKNSVDARDPYVIRDRKAFKSKLTTVTVVNRPHSIEWDLVPYSFDLNQSFHLVERECELWGAILIAANDSWTKDRMVALLNSITSWNNDERTAYAKHIYDAVRLNKPESFVTFAEFMRSPL